MKFLALTIALLTTSFSYADPSSNLKVNFSKIPAIIIPSPASTMTCGEIASAQTAHQGSIGNSYFTFPAPEITWIGDPSLSNVRIDAIVLKLDSRYTGEYKCIHSGTNVGMMFFQQMAYGDKIVVNMWDQILGRNSKNNTTSTIQLGTSHQLCDLKCGNLNLSQDIKKFTAHGTWEVHGVSRHFESEASQRFTEYPVKVRGKFTVKNVID